MLSSLSPAEHERLSRLAALAVAAVAAVACLYFFVRTAWLFVPREVPAPVSAPPASVTGATDPSVAKWHLFGNAQGLARPAASATLATVLKLALRGTLALPDARDERAMAIIANEQGVEASYRIGETVAPNATLSEVFADHVVIDHQGVAETLTLPRPDQHSLPESRRGPAAAVASSVPPGIQRPAPASAPAPSAGAPAAASRPIDARELASQIRPVFGSDGRIVGANIGGADASLLARVGLKPTDVVTAINGTPLASVTDPQALMNQLQGSASIQVTVQRDGRPATLTLSLR